MEVAWKVGRRTFAVGLVTLLAGCGGSGELPAGGSNAVPSPAPVAPARTATASGDAESVANDPALSAAGTTAATWLAEQPADRAWALPDAILGPLDRLWDAQRGAYVSPGGQISTRLNAEILRIHAAAARAGHEGPARRDDRVARLCDYLAGPAFVATTAGEQFGRSRHNVIHVPGWRQSSLPPINQHLSIDATVARGLRAAWLVRDRVGLAEPTRNAILRNVVAAATSNAFRAPARLLNQINWNADLYAASATISGDPSPLLNDYRAQLRWFARHAHRPVLPGALPNLSGGDGFHYQPSAPYAAVNRSDTVEYANVVLGVLRHYDEALRAGMRPLPAADRRTLAAWRDRVVRTDWTASGYLNWETGKGASRLHLRQYWALALDGAVMAKRGSSRLVDPGAPSSPAATVPKGSPAADPRPTGAGTGTTERSTDPRSAARATTASGPTSAGPTADALLARGVALFRRWSASAGTVLLPATSFGFPSTFVGVRENRVTASVRAAATVAEWAADCRCDGRLAPAPAAPLRVTLDPDLRRLTVNGPRYATAISPVARPTGGGLEPAWILDAQGRPIGPLGGGGDGAFGLRVERPGRSPLDSQPGVARTGEAALTPDPADPATVRGTLEADGAQLRIRHRFTPTAIETQYRVVPGGPALVRLRIPSAGRTGSVTCEAASTPPDRCAPAGPYLVRSGDATMRVALRGLPSGARVRRTRPPARNTLPDPGTELTIRFRTARPVTIERVLTPLSD